MVSDVNLEPTRDGFGRGLLRLGGENKNIVVLCADLTESTRAGWFMKRYPERFFAMGVSEQDMFSTAAGLALTGKIPFACTFGVFASGRAWDQIRVSIAYMNLNVNIVGTHGGITVGQDGATHQALEELALMRVIPNMAVIAPCDAREAEKATIAAAGWDGPVYLRLGRSPMPNFTDEKARFEIGRASLIRDGGDVSVITCGHMVYESLKAAGVLEKKGIDVRVINLHTIKPIDRDMILKAANETGAIVTAEEHTTLGGFGGAVCEALATGCPVPVEMIGVRDKFGLSGKSNDLMKKFGLTGEDIVKAVEKVLVRKRACEAR